VLEEKIHDKKPLYSKTAARAESSRCLFCHDAPCITHCPTEINIPQFIRQIANDDIKGAAVTILASNKLGYSCARVCPTEVLCVGACVYNHSDNAPIQIGRLQRFAVEVAEERFGFLALLPNKRPPSGKKVALIGSGPVSWSAAAELALLGHGVTIFEKKAVPGGLNSLGIAPYKLQKKDAIKEIEWLSELGIELRLNNEISANSVGSLVKEYDALFLGVGLGEDKLLNIDDLSGPGVYGATALIEQIKNDAHFDLSAVKIAHVIGGGNTAIDIAHELKLLGVEHVTMLYHRAEKDMSGYAHEIDAARKSGVVFREHEQLKELVRDQNENMHITVFDSSEQKSYKTQTDLVALAIGQQKIIDLAEALGVNLDSMGRVIIDEQTGRTSNLRVWSGGDCCSGGKEVVNAVQEGKIAALSIHEYLVSQKNDAEVASA